MDYGRIIAANPSAPIIPILPPGLIVYVPVLEPGAVADPAADGLPPWLR